LLWFLHQLLKGLLPPFLSCCSRDHILLVSLSNGKLVALDKNTGAKLWTFDSGAPLLSATRQQTHLAAAQAPDLAADPGELLLHARLQSALIFWDCVAMFVSLISACRVIFSLCRSFIQTQGDQLQRPAPSAPSSPAQTAACTLTWQPTTATRLRQAAVALYFWRWSTPAGSLFGSTSSPTSPSFQPLAWLGGVKGLAVTL
jgi:hypothetical protein